MGREIFQVQSRLLGQVPGNPGLRTTPPMLLKVPPQVAVRMTSGVNAQGAMAFQDNSLSPPPSECATQKQVFRNAFAPSFSTYINGMPFSYFWVQFSLLSFCGLRIKTGLQSLSPSGPQRLSEQLGQAYTFRAGSYCLPGSESLYWLLLIDHQSYAHPQAKINTLHCLILITTLKGGYYYDPTLQTRKPGMRRLRNLSKGTPLANSTSKILFQLHLVLESKFLCQL